MFRNSLPFQRETNCFVSVVSRMKHEICSGTFKIETICEALIREFNSL